MLNQSGTNSVVSCTTLSSVQWQNWDTCSFTDELAIFRFEWPYQIAPEAIASELTPAEIDRAHRFRRQEDQHRFVHGRCILRRLLGNYLGQSPATIVLAEGVNRKPMLTNAPGWHFNLSHSGNWILVAVSQQWVGVDLEKCVPEFDYKEILSPSFSESEQRFITESLHCTDAFYTLWTRKEALVKATAKGVDEDFARIPSLDGSHTVDSLIIGASGNWQVNSFLVEENYPAAVAHPLKSKAPQFYTLDRRFLG